MAKILLISPSTWGRGISPIWVASHTASLKVRGHLVELFDCTFYEQWSVNEIKINTENKQYIPSDYGSFIKMKTEDIFEAAQKKQMILNRILYFGQPFPHIFMEKGNTPIYKMGMI